VMGCSVNGTVVAPSVHDWVVKLNAKPFLALGSARVMPEFKRRASMIRRTFDVGS
jgi:hypothetical protein